MNHKVDELTEWVAEQIGPLVRNYVLGYVHCLNGLEPELKRVLDCYTKQILSHPDLALIDRDILTNPHTTISEMLDAITPIAEALKGGR